MSSGDRFIILNAGDSHILYDADVISEPSVSLFDADYHTNQNAQQKKSLTAGPDHHSVGTGRAGVHCFKHENRVLVLKHYYRGGMVRRFSRDRYIGIALEHTRAFREWRLLKKMAALDLPVPVAVAARVQKGWLNFRMDLITQRIENSKPLAEILAERSLENGLWHKIGACIARFHRHDIYHADLNAGNILLVTSSNRSFTDVQDSVYLIDFDNSGFRVNSSGWKMANIARLQRSLLKLKRRFDGFHFSPENWDALIAGYHSTENNG